MYSNKLLLVFFASFLGFIFPAVLVESQLPPCRGGLKGEDGPTGYPGRQGEKGEPGKPANHLQRPPPGAQCLCPQGPRGNTGPQGESGGLSKKGSRGEKGRLGHQGQKGVVGEPGRPGKPGRPGSQLIKYPASTPGTNYVAVVVGKRLPRTTCHHITRLAYVPNVPNKWLGWYENGQSSYSTYNDWLYYSSKFVCPCSLPHFPVPTPSS